jgi:hypothetical protein
MEAVKKGQQIHQAITAPDPRPHETRCAGCQGLVATETLFEGRCIICWATEAKRRRVESN